MSIDSQALIHTFILLNGIGWNIIYIKWEEVG